jgi:hypothetical protein
LVVEAAKGAVQFEFLLGEEGKFGEIATAFGFGDEDAELALARLDGMLLDFLDSAEDFGLFRGLGFVQQHLGQHGALGGIFDDFHGVAGVTAGKGLKSWKCAKMLKPCGLVEDGFGGEAAGLFAFRVCDGQGAKEDAFNFAEGGGAGLDVVAATESGLAKLFAKNG